MPMVKSRQEREAFKAALLDAIGKGGLAGRDAWAAKRQEWLTATGKPRVELEDLDLGEKTLRGYDLSHCRIHGTSFAKANLRDVDFNQSIFRGCDFQGANIRGASFFGADLRDEPPLPPNRLIGTRFDRTTDMEVRRPMLAKEMDRGLTDMANAAWRRTDWLHRRSTSLVYWALKKITDYGFGIRRLFLVALAAVGGFAGIFYLSDPRGTVGGALLDSTRYFIALGDPYESSHPLLSAVGMVEAGFGLIALAMLIAIFTSKFTDL